MSSRRGVIFHGYYGQRNAGDDTFARVASKIAEDLEVKRFGFTSPRAPWEELNIPGRAIYPDRARFPGHLRTRVLAATVAAGTSVFFGGSTIFQRQRALDDQMALVRIAHVRLHGCGISVGPFRTSEDEARVARYLTRFDTLSVRDRSSFERVASLAPGIELTQGFDPAVLLPEFDRPHPPLEKKSRGVKPIIGVSICGTETRGGNPRADALRFDTVRSLVNRTALLTGAQVRLIVMNGHPKHGDASITAEFARRLDPAIDVEVVPYSPDTRVLIRAISECTAVVAMRLHAGIFGFATGVPVLFSAYHQKSVDFAEIAGYPKRVLTNPDDAAAAWRDHETLLAMLEGHDRESYMPTLSILAARGLADRGVQPLRRALIGKS